MVTSEIIGFGKMLKTVLDQQDEGETVKSKI